MLTNERNSKNKKNETQRRKNEHDSDQNGFLCAQLKRKEKQKNDGQSESLVDAYYVQLATVFHNCCDSEHKLFTRFSLGTKILYSSRFCGLAF